MTYDQTVVSLFLLLPFSLDIYRNLSIHHEKIPTHRIFLYTKDRKDGGKNLLIDDLFLTAVGSTVAPPLFPCGVEQNFFF